MPGTLLHLLLSLVLINNPEGSYYHPHFTDGKRETWEVKSHGQGHIAIKWFILVFYMMTFWLWSLLPSGTIMHMALAKILNWWTGSNSVRPVTGSQVCTLTGTHTDILEVCKGASCKAWTHRSQQPLCGLWLMMEVFSKLCIDLSLGASYIHNDCFLS